MRNSHFKRNLCLHENVFLLSLEILYETTISQIIAMKVFAEEIFHSLINRFHKFFLFSFNSKIKNFVSNEKQRLNYHSLFSFYLYIIFNLVAALAFHLKQSLFYFITRISFCYNKKIFYNNGYVRNNKYKFVFREYLHKLQILIKRLKNI